MVMSPRELMEDRIARVFPEGDDMKRKRRIIVGAAAMAAAVSLGACSSGTGAESSNTQIESAAEEGTTAQSGNTGNTKEGTEAKSGNTAEASGEGQTEHTEESGAHSTKIEYSSEGTSVIEIFDEGHNYNPVVYGPPKNSEGR